MKFEQYSNVVQRLWVAHKIKIQEKIIITQYNENTQLLHSEMGDM